METRKKPERRSMVFLLRELNPELRIWDVLVDPARKNTYREQVVFRRR